MALNKTLTKNYTYSQARKTEYPSISEQFDLFWHAIDDGAFGDSAKCVRFATGKPREFTKEEVLERLREFSDNALKWEERE